MRGSVGCPHAVIVSPADERILKLQIEHPRLKVFLSKFSDQFGEEVAPSVLLIHKDAPLSYRTAEAVTGFRDVLSLSVVPYARATRFPVSSGLTYTNTFQFYPWMIDKNYEEMILVNPAMMHQQLLSEFRGQPFPEQPLASIGESDIDLPLANALVARWITRFTVGEVSWQDKALFRSLNMANEAGRIPAQTAAVHYDAGRSVALWVSAYEILAHPGGNGRSDFDAVADLLERVQWVRRDMATLSYPIGRPPKQRTRGSWICRQVYDRRNDFLHGNDVDGSALALNRKPMTDLAAAVFRLVLTGFLDLRFNEPAPDESDTKAFAEHYVRRMRFNTFQEAYGRCLLDTTKP
jgi:hypothetical protein